MLLATITYNYSISTQHIWYLFKQIYKGKSKKKKSINIIQNKKKAIKQNLCLFIQKFNKR